MARELSWWIKERHNPQMGTYYVPCGQKTVKDAKAATGKAVYGHNTMHRFATEAEYNAKLEELARQGQRVMR